MSKENVELVRRALRSVETFWGLLDEHVVWDLRDRPQVFDLDEVYVGRDAVIKASRHYWGTWDEYQLDWEEPDRRRDERGSHLPRACPRKRKWRSLRGEAGAGLVFQPRPDNQMGGV